MGSEISINGRTPRITKSNAPFDLKFLWKDKVDAFTLVAAFGENWVTGKTTSWETFFVASFAM